MYFSRQGIARFDVLSLITINGQRLRSFEYSLWWPLWRNLNAVSIVQPSYSDLVSDAKRPTVNGHFSRHLSGTGSPILATCDHWRWWLGTARVSWDSLVEIFLRTHLPTLRGTRPRSRITPREGVIFTRYCFFSRTCRHVNGVRRVSGPPVEERRDGRTTITVAHGCDPAAEGFTQKPRLAAASETTNFPLMTPRRINTPPPATTTATTPAARAPS